MELGVTDGSGLLLAKHASTDSDYLAEIAVFMHKAAPCLQLAYCYDSRK
jgi:hypothetical protein